MFGIFIEYACILRKRAKPMETETRSDSARARTAGTSWHAIRAECLRHGCAQTPPRGCAQTPSVRSAQTPPRGPGRHSVNTEPGPSLGEHGERGPGRHSVNTESAARAVTR